MLQVVSFWYGRCFWNCDLGLKSTTVRSDFEAGLKKEYWSYKGMEV